MKREIRFRGQSINAKRWVIGSLLMINGKSYMHEGVFGDLNDLDFGHAYIEVLPESVGQFTGFTAEKCKINLDKDIYEGDLFRQTTETDDGDVVEYLVVMWIPQRGAFYLVNRDHYNVLKYNDVSKEKDFSWLFDDAALYDFSLDIGLTKVGNIHEPINH